MMALRLPEILTKTVAARWRQFVAFLALCFVLILLLILAAPTILSSNLAQNLLKSTLSTTLQGPVNWSSLQLSWRRGLQLRNLTIGPASGTLQQARLAEIDCRPGFGFGANSGESFGIDLYLHLHDLQLELSPASVTEVSPPPPTEEALDPLTALAQGIDRFITLSWPLPIDLRVDIAVDPISVTYHDLASGRRLRFAEGDLQVKIPSLERAPLTFSLNGQVAVDDHPLGELRLATEIAGLVAPSGRIVPAGALLSAFVDFPGLALKADGRLNQKQGLQGELRLDLPQLQEVAAPFLPGDLPNLGGTLLATLQARVDSEQNLALSCTLAGQKLRVDAAGPLDFNLGQQIRTDHRRQLVTLGGGVLMIPQLLEANWEARVEEPNSPARRVSARLHQLEIDLEPALALAAPFLPPGLPQLGGGHLQLRDLDLQLRGTQGDGELRLARAVVALPSVRLGELAVTGVDLVTTDFDIPLNAYFPASLAAGIDWQVAGIDLRGAQPLTLTGLAGAGSLAITEISKGEGEGKLVAKGRFDHKLHLKGALAAGVAQLSALANDLHLAFALQPDGSSSVESLEFVTDIAALTVTSAGKDLPPLPLRQTLHLAGVELRPGETIPVVNSLVFSISSPELVNVTGEGNLTAARLLTLKTQSRLELPRFIALAAPLLPEKLTAKGAINNELQLVATLPDRPLPAGQAPLRSAKNALSLLQELNENLQLDGVELYLPLANGSLHLSGIQTASPVNLRSTNYGEKIDLAGAIAFDLRAGSTINGKVLPVEHGQVTFSGELRDWDRAFLAESIQIAPLGLSERFELSISGLAALLDMTFPPTPATLLQRLDATLFGEIDLNLPADAPQLLPEDLTITGKTLAGTRVDLRAGHSLRLHAYADVEDLNVKIAKGPQVQGLQAHLNLDRVLQIRSAATTRPSWLPLSTSLVQPLPPPLAAPLAGERRRLHDDLRGSSGGARSLGIQSLTLPGLPLPLPLTISALEAEMATGQEELGLRFLQAELLNGTLRAGALLDLRPTVPVLSTEALFTNLDLSRLKSDITEEESSISGEFSLSVPLHVEERPLLEGLTLAARLRQIGAKTFDRVLASLDPYERNEAIMSQRKMLRLGQLQGVEIQVVDGAFALSGAVKVKGVPVALPKIDRLRLADLSLHKELAPVLTAIRAARPPLEFIRADTIAIDAQGQISLRKEEK